MSRHALATAALLVLCGVTSAWAGDETYRDPVSKETLFIADGPNVSYASLKRSSLRPLKIVDHDDAARIIRVKFDKSPTVWALTLDEAHARIVCEAPGEPRQVFERIKVDPAGLPGTTAAPGQTVRVLSPSDGASVYEPSTEFSLEVTDGCTRVEAVSLNAAGEVQARGLIAGFKPGQHELKYRVSKALKNMSLGSNRFRFVATFSDGAVALAEVRVSFHEYEGEMAKPVIYLYPRATQAVSVRVTPKGGVTVSAPSYGDGWTVTATPEGQLTTAEGERVPYLFWESGLTEGPAPLPDGTVVSREALAGFLTRALTTLGLDGRESADFLEHWLPRMSASPFVAVRFVPRAEIDLAAPLDVHPAPDSVIRVLVDFRPLEAPIALPPQELVPATRHGFAVVEWGGLRYR